jgi:hypothetical protein
MKRLRVSARFSGSRELPGLSAGLVTVPLAAGS